MFDNQKIYEICEGRLKMRRISFNHLNTMISKTMAGITNSQRFTGCFMCGE